MSEEKVRRVEYTCAQCGAKDHVKVWPNEPTPPVINCWQCHAGFKMAIEDQVRAGKGMFPAVA